MVTTRKPSRAVLSCAARVIAVLALAVLTVPSVSSPSSALAATADTYWVDAAIGNDANDGSQVAPFKTITRALEVADSLDTVMIEPGTYGPATNGEPPYLDIEGECLQGAGAGLTVIDGSYLQWESMQADDFVEGLTVSNCQRAMSVVAPVDLVSPAQVRISDCTFYDNSGSYWGAGCQLYKPGPGHVNVLVDSCWFVGNHSDGRGGALAVTGYVDATVRDCTFIGNSSGDQGGALYVYTNDAAAFTCEDCSFFSNTAVFGGAFAMQPFGSGEHLLQDNLFANNSSTGSGGALWLSAGSAETPVVTLLRNEADSNSSFCGGFADMYLVEVRAENNVITRSHADYSGTAWYIDTSTFTEYHDTVTGSTGPEAAVEAVPGSTAVLGSSIYWNPDSEAGDLVNIDAVSYSCISDQDAGTGKGNTLGAGNIYDDPQLIGGSVYWFDPSPMLGSPCIDAADPASTVTDDFFGADRPCDGDGNGTALPDMGCVEHPTLALGEVSGDDRYETAAQIALANFDQADTALVASGANYPDALSAAGLAGVLDAPLLLTKPTDVPDVLTQTLQTLGVTNVVLIGGTSAISEAVATELDQDFLIDRIAGSDRYDTAALVARRIADLEGDDYWPHALIARGDAFPDALAVSPIAYRRWAPILLTRPGSLPGPTADAIDDLDLYSATIVGGTAAVSTAVQAQVDALLAANSGVASERVAGNTRYATAVAVADWAVDEGILGWTYVGIATGQNYPDALAGGVGAGVQGGVVGLTPSTSLCPETGGMLEDHRQVIMYVDVFGGPAAVSPTTRSQIEEALTW